jgi:hypothetical protein
VTPAGEPAPTELPPRLVVVAYAIALVCLVAPLAVLGAGFAGAALFTRGRHAAGAGVVAVAVLCAALGLTMLR